MLCSFTLTPGPKGKIVGEQIAEDYSQVLTQLLPGFLDSYATGVWHTMPVPIILVRNVIKA